MIFLHTHYLLLRVPRWSVRSRLYRSRILQGSTTGVAGFFETYRICTLLHYSDVRNSINNRHNLGNFSYNFRFTFHSFSFKFDGFRTDFDVIWSEFHEMFHSFFDVFSFFFYKNNERPRTRRGPPKELNGKG